MKNCNRGARAAFVLLVSLPNFGTLDLRHALPSLPAIDGAFNLRPAAAGLGRHWQKPNSHFSGDGVLRLRGGLPRDEDNYDTGNELGQFSSTLANPAFIASKAFAPQEALPETNRTVIPAGPKYAWFYPDPPWGRKDKYMPGSKFLKLWHALVFCAMMYIAVIIPFQAAGFTIDPNDSRSNVGLAQALMEDRSLLESAIDLIFIADIAFTFHTALYEYRGNGHLVLVHKLSDIRRHYLHSPGFYWDICGIIPFKALILILSHVPNLFRAHSKPPFTADPQVANLFKILRMAKLSRLHHFQLMWAAIHYHFPGKGRIFELVKLFAQIFFTGHVLACAWYWVGLGKGGWVDHHIKESDPWVSRYVSSFYFIYATITTVGYGDIAGLSSPERVLSVGLMVIGSFIFGLIIGSVPAILDRRSFAGGRYLELERRLKEYLQHKKVPTALQGRILQFFEYRYPERRSFDGHKIIQDLPLSMQKALVVHVYDNLISTCGILHRCSYGTLGEICLLLRKVFVAEGDLISKEGTAPVGLYFIKHGQVLLSRGWEVETAVGPGAVFGQNVAVGLAGFSSDSNHLMHTATALEPAELCVLLQADFEDVVAARPDFVPTYDHDAWMECKEEILRRRDVRLGVAKQKQVMAALVRLRAGIRELSNEDPEAPPRHPTPHPLSDRHLLNYNWEGRGEAGEGRRGRVGEGWRRREEDLSGGSEREQASSEREGAREGDDGPGDDTDEQMHSQGEGDVE